MSIWNDITHDPTIAQEAIDELERTAAHLDGLTQSRAALARQAAVDWQGALRAEFDRDLSRLLEHSEELIQQLRATARRITEETEAAATEQRRRERSRELWPRPEPGPQP